MRTSYIDREQMRCVLAALTPQNRLVCRVCLHTGLRVSDVLALRTDQLAARFSVLESKTGKRRRVSLDAALLADLRASAGDPWVFPGARDSGRHRTRQAVWRDVKRAAKAFRLPGNVGTHSCRKFYAVQLMHKYGDISRVRRALNHDNDLVTILYALADLVPQKPGF